MSRKAVKHIKTWSERCEEHPDHQEGIITERMIQARMQEEIDELRQALETEQEPVCWTVADGWVYANDTPQPSKPWVGLTEEEKADLFKDTAPYYNETDYADAIEAKLREKNGGEYRNGATTERTKLSQEITT